MLDRAWKVNAMGLWNVHIIMCGEILQLTLEKTVVFK